jgi:hypothetical protein
MDIRWFINGANRTANDDAIFEVYWTAFNAQDETQYIKGVTQFSPDASSESFIPFSDLSEAQIALWIEQKEGLSNVVTGIIDKYAAPKVLAGLPWDPPEFNPSSFAPPEGE